MAKEKGPDESGPFPITDSCGPVPLEIGMGGDFPLYILEDAGNDFNSGRQVLSPVIGDDTRSTLT